ncbi:trypco2 family protein [Streptomyces sp. WMMB 322]|uniref:trypco2 family protein n=1 Tax=Streptomyces sp. WMMB 322 TaxID=1286821 RepID=UPI0006E209ED|nr:trypco2 family protein [Streptomyces sp. WMMB 322]SCK20753.1 hypothetical protein H180DRAFT_01519 [Streptomyces sp. WMMB 322]
MAGNGEQRQPIELSELVRQLRTELKTAAAEGAEAGEQLQFELGPVEVEATVAAGRDKGASGKVRFWVVDAGGDARFTRSQTQRITLTLHPRRVGEDGTTRSPLISGDELRDEI